MNLILSDQAWEDYQYWQKTDKRTVHRIHELLKDIRRNPHSGIGKPEPLRHALTGWWSRRIDQEHRIIYRVTERGIELAQMRYHY